MDVVGRKSISSTKPVVEGVVGCLPDRMICSCSCMPSTSRNWLQNRNSNQRAAVSSSKPRKSNVIFSQQDDGRFDLREMKSMQDQAKGRSGLGEASLYVGDRTGQGSEEAKLNGSNIKKRVAIQPPRFATLRSFGEAGGEGVVTGEFEGTSVFELIAANIEASKQVKNWEVFSGRLAMLAMSTALGVEIFTGNSVFSGVDAQKLKAVAALCAVATLSAGAFACAWRAKADVVTLMSKGYKNMVESALDNLIDGLFFDET